MEFDQDIDLMQQAAEECSRASEAGGEKQSLLQPEHSAMEDKELEVYVHRWVARQIKKYPDHHFFGNANDLGRDAAGCRTLNRHEGEWDNYQCKMLTKCVDDAMMHREIAKILFHASEGQFTPPGAYFFVAPKGFNRKAEKLLFSPSSLKQQMLNEWDARCARRIRAGLPVVFTDDLRAVIEAYPFQNIAGFDLSKILTMDDINLGQPHPSAISRSSCSR